MTNYLLRSETGVLVAEIPYEAGMDIISNMAGIWSSVDYHNGPRIQRYTLQEGRVLELTNGEFKITLMIWKGMMLDLTDLSNTPYKDKL